MEYVIPKPLRSEIEEKPAGIYVTISNRNRLRTTLKLLLRLFGLLAWLLFFFVLFSAMSNESVTNLLHNVIVWLWIGVVIFDTAIRMTRDLWDIFGIETIDVQEYGIRLGRQVFWWHQRQYYVANSIQQLRVATKLPAWVGRSWYWQSWQSQYGVFAFDYGAETIHFGGRIDEAEGRQILAIIEARFPRYAPVTK